jgi:hypothetical protein
MGEIENEHHVGLFDILQFSGKETGTTTGYPFLLSSPSFATRPSIYATPAMIPHDPGITITKKTN